MEIMKRSEQLCGKLLKQTIALWLASDGARHGRLSKEIRRTEEAGWSKLRPPSSPRPMARAALRLQSLSLPASSETLAKPIPKKPKTKQARVS